MALFIACYVYTLQLFAYIMSAEDSKRHIIPVHRALFVITLNGPAVTEHVWQISLAFTNHTKFFTIPSLVYISPSHLSVFIWHFYSRPAPRPALSHYLCWTSQPCDALSRLILHSFPWTCQGEVVDVWWKVVAKAVDGGWLVGWLDWILGWK